MKLSDLHENLFDKGYLAILGDMPEPDDADSWWIFTADEKAKAKALEKRLHANNRRDVGVVMLTSLNGFHIVAVTPNYVIDPPDGGSHSANTLLAFAPTEKSCLKIVNDLVTAGKIPNFQGFDDVFIVPIKIESGDSVRKTVKWLQGQDLEAD